jgi:hypothetical protein
MDKLLGALSAAVPRGDATTVVHGDFRLGNTIVDFDDTGNIRRGSLPSWTGNCPRSAMRWQISAS